MEIFTHYRQEAVFTPMPQPIIALMGIKIKQIALGRDHCLALTSNGTVYAWGDNSKNQLGFSLQPPQDDLDQFSKSKNLRSTSIDDIS